ncbi:hypothetical protein [Nocardia otitidiscaviarum]|uniref:hypothetical protein n=1 Tax=Nocardia otitidiscaviarum TaxID=1823 RepID=UPI0004A71227|nr:hypothetical protein [Nocardia otitidiscaviarum]
MNNTEDFIAVAGYALGKFSGDQLYFPNAGDTTVLSWADTFAHSGLTEDEIRAGVLHLALNASGGDFRPMPADVIRAAKNARQERLNNIPADRRRRMDDACHVLQDMGFTPNQAHHYTRALALGHTPDIDLTREQRDELNQRLAARAELAAAPVDPRINPFHRLLTRVADQKAIPS